MNDEPFLRVILAFVNSKGYPNRLEIEVTRVLPATQFACMENPEKPVIVNDAEEAG